jgi:predicted enzyme related to lactoylglutathione lyase
MSVTMKNVVVFVTDLARAKSFYVDQLGLPLAGETQMLMEFFPAAKGTTLGIALALQDAAKALVGRHTGVTLQVNGIDALCQRLSDGGVTFIEPLEASPWGKMAVVADPDGNQYALVEMPQ